jgi:hypothetical protein
MKLSTGGRSGGPGVVSQGPSLFLLQHTLQWRMSCGWVMRLSTKRSLVPWRWPCHRFKSCRWFLFGGEEEELPTCNWLPKTGCPACCCALKHSEGTSTLAAHTLDSLTRCLSQQ